MHPFLNALRICVTKKVFTFKVSIGISNVFVCVITVNLLLR